MIEIEIQVEIEMMKMNEISRDLYSPIVRNVLGALWELSGADQITDDRTISSLTALTNHSDSLIRERVAFVLGKVQPKSLVAEHLISWVGRENDQTVLEILVLNLPVLIHAKAILYDRAIKRLALLALDPSRDPDLRANCLNCLRFGLEVISLNEFSGASQSATGGELEEHSAWLLQVLRR